MVEELEILGTTMAATLAPCLTSSKTPGDVFIVLMGRENKSNTIDFTISPKGLVMIVWSNLLDSEKVNNNFFLVRIKKT